MKEKHESFQDETEAKPDGAREKPAEPESAVSPAQPIKRPDPARYGDWEKDGRCIDF